MKTPLAWAGLAAVLLTASGLLACSGSGSSTDTDDPPATIVKAGLQGEFLSPLLFGNPYSHVPAQCYTETSRGTQNPCQFCHTNGVYELGLGNNLPQAGGEERLGNLQLDYSFAQHHPTAPSGTVMRWENTLRPENLRAVVAGLGIDPATWDMQAYVRQDNWSAAYAQRPGDSREWDSGVNTPMRLFPGLSPADLPARADGFVRSTVAARGFFDDGSGWITGWRAVNFMPYGIFTPMTGSVSGIYIRLPKVFMQSTPGTYSLATYQANLDLVERAIQDRLRPEDGSRFVGAAADVVLRRGEYPVGTEFAHPLHYVDVTADGSDTAISPFPGTRARRVKEVRYMFKAQDFHHAQFRPGEKEEGLPVYGNVTQGWVDNGVGWMLAGYIEAADGKLRPQTVEELTQCVGCHSGVVKTEVGPRFTSGTGNTVDSTWALPRKWPGDAGWREMDYLGYRAQAGATATATPGTASLGDPLNRREGKGELRHFLDNVVGASLYGDMPAAIERHLGANVTRLAGYAADWPVIDTRSAEAFNASQATRQQLLRAMTARGGHLAADGSVHGALLYPPRQDALAGAARYRQVVVTQRFNLGKDVFDQTPVTLRYHRLATEGNSHLDGTAYAFGELITDRSVDRMDPTLDTYLVGNTATGVDELRSFADGGTYNPGYVPLLAVPLLFEPRPAGP